LTDERAVEPKVAIRYHSIPEGGRRLQFVDGAAS
jgi:hypothetical protein